MNYPAKFIIYLPDSFFNNSCCLKCNHKLIDTLYLRGVRPLPFEFKNPRSLYDDNKNPEMNVLYILLMVTVFHSLVNMSRPK